MSARQFVIFLVVAALAAPLLRKLWDAAQSGADSALPNGKPSPVVEYVEQTLHDHMGEDTPLVHAFEAALEQTRQAEHARA